MSPESGGVASNKSRYRAPAGTAGAAVPAPASVAGKGGQRAATVGLFVWGVGDGRERRGGV